MALGRSSCWQLPGRCTSAPAASERAGGLNAVLSLRHFGLARCWSLSLGAGRRGARGKSTASMTRGGGHFVFAKIAGALDRREPPIFLLSDLRCGPIDGARTVELLAATGSLHIGAGRERTGRGALRRALASTFRAGAMLVFIPWCRGAEARAANRGKRCDGRYNLPCARIV